MDDMGLGEYVLEGVMHVCRERLKRGVVSLIAMYIDDEEPAPSTVLVLGRHEGLCG